MTTVAVIGGGFAGICSAKECIQHGLLVTIFESRPVLGGTWSKHDTPVFENLTTNTSVYETALSDIPPLRVTESPILKEDSLCCTRDEVYDYLQHVIDQTPGLRESARLSTKVVNIERSHGKFQVSFNAITDGDLIRTEIYDRVIIASGRLAKPVLPTPQELPGIDKFNDKIMHVREYQRPSQMRDKRVLVVGGSISGCEVAGDMAAEPAGSGPKTVTLSTRTMRYLASKQIGTRVIISFASTRFHSLRSLAGRYGDDEFIRDLMREFQNFSNSDYGAPEPSGPVKRPFVPGWVPVNQKLLNASKNRKVEWKIGGLKQITERGAEFLDGSVGEYDKIIFATGYIWDLSFLAKEMLDKVTNPDAELLNLYDFTFNPEIENLAVVGVFPPGSASLPIIDAQARWVARVFSGEVRNVGKQSMWDGINAYKAWRRLPESHFLLFGFEILDRIARHGGFDVDLSAYPELAKGLIFSPMVPAQFRMFGHGKSEEGRDECIRQLRASGFDIGDNKISEEEMKELHEILNVIEKRDDCPRGLREAVDHLRYE